MHQNIDEKFQHNFLEEDYNISIKPSPELSSTCNSKKTRLKPAVGDLVCDECIALLRTIQEYLDAIICLLDIKKF